MLLRLRSLNANAAPGRRRALGLRAMASATNAPKIELSEQSGIKIASADNGGPTTSLSVIVNAGSRYEPAPGLAHLLQRFAFANTTKRTSFRIHRESELLGGLLQAKTTREHLVIRSDFMREDLPYYVELLGDVVSKTKFTDYELPERIAQLVFFDAMAASKNSLTVALDVCHGVAFRRGLGNSLYADPATMPHIDAIRSYAQSSYTRPNMTVVASGVQHAELAQFVGEYFADVPSGTAAKPNKTKYFGGESRAKSPAASAFVIGFEGKPSPIVASREVDMFVLNSLLDGATHMKWNVGTNPLALAAAEAAPGVKALAQEFAYSDGGLFTINITGPPSAIRRAAENSVKKLKEIASGVKSEDMKSAIAKAKFSILSIPENRTLFTELIGRSILSTGKAPSIDQIANEIEKVSADKISKVSLFY